MPKVGRPPVLDDKKKSEVLTLLTVGCSQVVAARYVGCCARTIRRTAQQDPEFGQKFRDARTSAERALIERLHAASQDKRYWRAAAWLLERTLPQRYAARGADVITVEQIGQLMAQFLDVIDAEVPTQYRKPVIQRFRDLVVGLSHKPNKAAPKPTALTRAPRATRPRVPLAARPPVLPAPQAIAPLAIEHQPAPKDHAGETK